MWKPGETIFDLDVLKQELDTADVQEDLFNDCMIKSVFLGTVFALTPSGKYYMPFACSNVDACPQCKGRGSVGAHKKRRIRRKAAKRYEQMMERHRLSYDAALSEAERKKISDKAIAEYPQRQRYQRMAQGTTCTHCEGVGSREAYLDELWREQAEEELGRIDAYLTSGEGDPCDLFAEMAVE